jgi:hypothetical protein
MGTTEHPISNDKFADQIWNICSRCGCVQLKNVLPLEVLYQSSHTPGTVGTTWNQHHDEFAKFVQRHRGTKILEIGAGNMHLANAIFSKSTTPFERYVVMDPNIDSSRLPSWVTLVPSLFDPANSRTLPADIDTIILSHTLEHLYEPRYAIHQMASALPIGGKLICSVPLIDVQLQMGWTNSLNFEHIYLTTLSNLNYLFGVAGFFINEKKLFTDDNIFIAATKTSTAITDNAPQEYSRTKPLMEHYLKEVLDTAQQLNGVLLSLNDYSKYLFGAHVFSQALLYNGVSETQIEAVLDNDPNKLGKRLYGTSLYVKAPQTISSQKKCAVIVRAGRYTKEVKQQIVQINPDVIIL